MDGSITTILDRKDAALKPKLAAALREFLNWIVDKRNIFEKRCDQMVAKHPDSLKLLKQEILEPLRQMKKKCSDVATTQGEQKMFYDVNKGEILVWIPFSGKFKRFFHELKMLTVEIRRKFESQSRPRLIWWYSPGDTD